MFYVYFNELITIKSSFTEGGLSSALQTTETLYSKDLDKLAEMTAEDLSLVLDGAPIIELLPKPGMTVYNLALEAGCFPRDGELL